jgi:hypothetical protein
LDPIEREITLAEECAAAAYAAAAAYDAVEAANVYAFAADPADPAYADWSAASGSSKAAALAAYARLRHRAAAYAADAADDAARIAGDAVPFIARDFKTILTLAQKNQWTDDTPVTPSVFGPLDAPLEEPKPDPVEVDDRDFKLILRAYARPGVSAEFIKRHIVGLFDLLNEYSIEKYGRRLTKDRFRRLVVEHTEVPV